MGRDSMNLMKGTLDLLVMKTVSLKPLHGYDISKWVRERTNERILIDDSALYQALRRLENRGWLVSEWRESPTGREAKFYQLTPEGKNQLMSRTQSWRSYVEAMSTVLVAAEI